MEHTGVAILVAVAVTVVELIAAIEGICRRSAVSGEE
jgi:hypothetical protein